MDSSIPKGREKECSRLVSLLAILSIVIAFNVLPGAQAASAAASTRVAEKSKASTKTRRPVRIAVIGDSLAFELYKGMHAAYRNDKSVKFVKYTRVSTGLIRRDIFNWNRKIRDFVKSHKFDIAVVVMGGNDRQSLWHKKRRLTRGSKAWFKVYSQRAEAFMKTLKSAGKPVYWVGLPVVRSATMSRDYKRFNRLFKRLSSKYGFRYVNMWKVFADKKGRYTSFGRDAAGTKRRMRNDDGLHFSGYGRLKFGRAVFKRIKRNIRTRKSGLETGTVAISDNG